MKNIDYFKEKLNTLRVEFMAKVFIMIAIGSGLSKMYLNTLEMTTLSDEYKTIYMIGLLIFSIFLITSMIDLRSIDKLTKNLKDKK